jgi:hypothetical protein
MQNSRIGTSEAMLNAKPKKLKEKSKMRRYLGIFSFFVGILLVAATLFAVQFLVLPGFKVLGYLENIKDNASLLLQDLSVKSIANLETYLGNIQNELSKIDDEISRYEFLKSIDQTKGYYENFQTGRRILDKGNTLIEYSLPKLKNILTATGFSTDKNASSVLGSLETKSEDEESSISLIMKELPLYLNLYNEIEPQIIGIFEEVAKIDPNYVPSLPNFNISDNLVSINNLGKEFPTLSQKTVNLIKYLPDLLGSNQDSTFLVVMQNEAEMRSSGGILTAYGDVTLRNGEISNEIKLDDTNNLQLYLWQQVGLPMPHYNIYGQLYLMNKGCGASEARAQDSNHYPDIYESLMMFKDYYDMAREHDEDEFADYDNIVILNFAFAQNLLSLVQPLTVEGFGEVTADSLFSFIKAETDNTDKYQAYDEGRKDIIGEVSTAVKEKLFNLPYSDLPKIINLIVKSFQARDLGLASKDAEMQAYFDAYGMSGRYEKDVTGDYFALAEAQNCSLKLNRWVRNTVQHNVNINNDGSIGREVKVKWQQPKIYDDSLYGQYDSTLRFSYRAWVRFVMPKDSFNIESDGYERSGYLYYFPQKYYDKVFNKQVSDNVVQFDHRRFDESDPIEKEEMNVSYNLPGSINYLSQGEYTLLLQKHPGKSWGETHTVNITDNDGNTHTIDVVLDRDKVVKFKNGVLSVDNYDTSLDWLMNDIVNRLPFDRLQ